MTLVERIEALRERAEGQSSLEQKRAESGRLQYLLNAARRLSEDLGSQVTQLRMLEDQGIETSAPDSAVAARKTLSKLRERFAKEPRAEQLTRGQDWTRLNEQIQATCRTLASALETEWRRFVGTAYSGESPNNLAGSLASTDGNMANLKRYRDAYAQITQYARSGPRERADFDRVRDLVRQLTEIYQGFDFNVPEDVKRFLRAVADGGANLDLLTAEVRDWLQQQNTGSQYRIVARASST
jgi:hypothetical protein